MVPTILYIICEVLLEYCKNILFNGIKDKKFFLAISIILLSMIFSLTSFLDEESVYFFKHDYVTTFLQGYNGDKSLLVPLAPLIATIPFAANHIENRKSGIIKNLIIRIGYDKYFKYTFLINIILSFLVFFISMFIFMLFSILFFDKNIDLDIYNYITKNSMYNFVANISPLFYLLILIIHCSIISAVYSSIGLSLSYYIKNKFIAWVFPFVITTIISLFSIFLGITKLELMAMFDVTRVKDNTFIFLLFYVSFFITTSYFIAYNKFKRDIQNDEEF